MKQCEVAYLQCWDYDRWKRLELTENIFSVLTDNMTSLAKFLKVNYEYLFFLRIYNFGIDSSVLPACKYP
jgi:hypothetical protein